MSHGNYWIFIGALLLACGTSNSGNPGAPAAAGSSAGQAVAGQPNSAGTTTGGSSDAPDCGGACGPQASAGRGGNAATPADDPDGGAGEPRAGAGAGGSASGPVGVLRCATPPIAMAARPSALRVTITFGSGPNPLVQITKGDALQRPESKLTGVLEASLPVAADNDGFQIGQEGLTLKTARGDGPEGVYTGTLNADGSTRPVSCWLAELEPHFRYEAATGKCSGRNRYPLEMVRETKVGECVDFPKGDLNGSDLGYGDLKGWNLAGADLSQAGVHFANLLEADLRGANLKGFGFGYANVVGTLDQYTQPPQGSCKTEGDELSCHQ